MVKVSISGKMEENMMVSGLMEKCMVKVFTFLKKIKYTKGISKMDRDMEKDK